MSLEDGNWHTLAEIEKNFNMPEDNLWRIIRFLEEYGFLSIEEKREESETCPFFSSASDLDVDT
jgi:uncharacterized membrane protein